MDAESAQVAKFPAKRIEVSPLHLATIRLDTKIVQSFLEHSEELNLDLNTVTHCGQTPLHYALMGEKDQLEGAKNMINLFFTHTVSKNTMDFNATDTKGNTAFHYACVQGMLPIIKLFLEHAESLGINLNTVNSHGETPLDLARRNRLKICDMDLIVAYLVYHKVF